MGGKGLLTIGYFEKVAYRRLLALVVNGPLRGAAAEPELALPVQLSAVDLAARAAPWGVALPESTAQVDAPMPSCPTL
jgi:hypothetical protein